MTAHTATTYQGGCRCRPCTAAHTTRIRTWRENNHDARTLDHEGRLVAPAPPDHHGRNSTYISRGCRCRPCTAAHTAAARHTRTEQRPAPDTRRPTP